MGQSDSIIIRGASEHNLQHIDIAIPRDSFVVITGLSGSGKSSLAFDTIYAEGQRRYVESLSAYARQFLDQMHKPRVEMIEGLSPAISIEQKTIGHNPRSTVGTVTEVYDFLRVLYANVGRPHCPKCGRPIESQTVDKMVDVIQGWPAGTKFHVLAPIVRGRKGEYHKELEDARRQGFVRARVDGRIVDLDDPPKLKKSYKHDISIVVDRLTVAPAHAARLRESVELSLRMAEGLVETETIDDGRVRLFSEKYACPDCGESIDELTHRLFSFNSPVGACPKCEGLGTMLEVDEPSLVPNPDLSIDEGALLQWMEATSNDDMPKHGFWDRALLKALAEHYDFRLDVSYKKLPKHVKKLLLWGNGGEQLSVEYTTRSGTSWKTGMTWEGMVPRVKRRHSEEHEQELGRFMRELPCPECGGQRLRPAARAVRLGGLNISELCAMTTGRALDFINRIDLTPRERQIGAPVLKEVRERLGFLMNVGLHYLSLDRGAGTLSGGEAQRTRLATQIGSQLVGVLYVLDEPSIGLHQRDNQMLLDTLKNLRDAGNTVVVVEHDEPTIRQADYIVDLGPGAGRLGGHVVASGKPADIERSNESVTGRFLRGDERIETPRARRTPDPARQLVVRGAREHNMKNVDVAFPLGLFICVTGVSGSGKSTLVVDILYRALSNQVYRSHYKPGDHDAIDGIELVDKVVDVDQGPIGRTPRSNPATYTGVFSPIRDMFAQLPESRVRGYKPGRFSFNVKSGRCESCRGDGLIKVEMHFLPDVYVECEICGGRRYNRETLEVLYAGKSIADVLEMTVEEACDLFTRVPAVRHKLRTLNDVGLGYITLGQSATTLSGGEAQRVKLAKELSRRGTGKTVYILDEPTTGLHFDDVRKLLAVLQALTDQGNTVIVIEHNLDVVKCADCVIDLGPEGGDEGGYVTAAGTPEKVAANPASVTGRYLREALSDKRRDMNGKIR
ncbi:MAG: excinuclease ABC subunit UvrA [Candidatus Sumerlaeota bacterium]|nr:excinuclease ABC subunit UvrA [Candidatus Sumerlaeota bacterium]